MVGVPVKKQPASPVMKETQMKTSQLPTGKEKRNYGGLEGPIPGDRTSRGRTTASYLGVSVEAAQLSSVCHSH